MKSLMRLVLSFFLVIAFTSPISAAENDTSQFYKILSDDDSSLVIHFYEDDVTYEFKTVDDEIIVTDCFTGEVVFVSQITYEYPVVNERYEITGIGLFDASYEDWNTAWSVYRRGQISLPSPDVANAISIVAGLLLSHCGILGVAASALITIATGYMDRSLDKAHYIQYYRTNLNCGILAKTYTEYYSNSNYTGLIGSSPEGYMWTDTPWNYSYPAPCRTLVSSYPL